MPQIIPLRALPSQTVNAVINGQQTALNVYQKQVGLINYGLFMDVILNDQPIIQGVICQNLNRIIRDTYLGYLGDFAWFDNIATEDPYYDEIGSRFFLSYWLPSELPTTSMSDE